MKEEEVIDSYCMHCNEETAHLVIYVDKFLKQRQCKSCGVVTEVDRKKLLSAYTDDLIDRILTKGYRLRKELQEDPAKAVVTLPWRITAKPWKEARKISNLVGKSKEVGKE